jgi:hypothetical protein
VVRTQQSKSILELNAVFGNVSIGDKTARIGLTVDRLDLTLPQADRHLCEKRLIGSIFSRPPGDHPDQGTLPEMEFSTTISGAFDVKSFRVTKKHLNFGLTFAIASIDVALLAHFAERSGRLIVDDIDIIPEKEETKKE